MAEKLRRVVVGGGSGFVGGQLVHRLRQCGFFPVVVGREFAVEEVERKPAGALKTYAELAAEGLPQGTEAVVCLAGANIGLPFRSFDERYKAIVRSSRLGPTALLRQLVLDAPAEARPKAFVTASAVGAYPPSDTARYDETSQLPPPSDFFTQLVRDWEAAGEVGRDSGVRRTVLRIGLALGRTGGIVEQSYVPFYCGLGGPMGSGAQWFPWVHVDDVCGLVLHAIEQDGVSGVLNAVAPTACTNRDFARAFGAALGRPAVLPMPALAVRALFGKERAAMFLSGQRVAPKRALESGYRFLYEDIDKAAKEFARPLNDEERLRLKSNGTPISVFGHDVFADQASQGP